MSGGPIYVWSARGDLCAFASLAEALQHCVVVSGDRRAKRDVLVLPYSAVRFVGPRGRRRASRFVAFIGTRGALELLGIDVSGMLNRLEVSAS